MQVYYCCKELPDRQSQHALAYRILEQAVAEHYPACVCMPLEYERDERGKPHFKRDPWLQFNISHCRCGVAAALGEWPVGVDIERRFAWKENLARRLCAREEMDWLLSLEDEGQRTAWLNRIWGRKESYLKCVGFGFYRDPREFSVLGEMERETAPVFSAPADQGIEDVFSMPGKGGAAPNFSAPVKQGIESAFSVSGAQEHAGSLGCAKSGRRILPGKEAEGLKEIGQASHLELRIDGTRFHFQELQQPAFTLVACSEDGQLDHITRILPDERGFAAAL